MVSSSSTRTQVFISYSHADKEWLERLKRHLKPWVREGRLEYWDDSHVRPGDNWQQEIRNALDTAQVAVLLTSANFFASGFINENELPPLLAAAQAKGVRILPVILSASRFTRHPDLARFQAVNSPDWPLARMPLAEQEKVFDHLAQTIESALEDTTRARPLVHTLRGEPLRQITTEGEKRALKKALQAAHARGQSTIAALMGRSDMLSAKDFGALLGISPDTVHRWRQERKILALQDAKQGYRYPTWQLTRGHPLPGLERFLDAVRDDWVAYRWLTQHHPELGGITGIEALAEGKVQDLIELAKHFGEIFA